VCKLLPVPDAGSVLQAGHANSTVIITAIVTNDKELCLFPCSLATAKNMFGIP
jgi:hypothetical protein